MQVNSVEMLKKLLELDVKIPKTIFDFEGPVPFGFHFMSIRNLELVNVLLDSLNLEESHLENVIQYCENNRLDELAEQFEIFRKLISTPANKKSCALFGV